MHNRAIRNDPSKVGLQHNLAQLLIRMGQLPQAQALLSKCLERARDGGGSMENLATDVDT